MRRGGGKEGRYSGVGAVCLEDFGDVIEGDGIWGDVAGGGSALDLKGAVGEGTVVNAFGVEVGAVLNGVEGEVEGGGVVGGRTGGVNFSAVVEEHLDLAGVAHKNGEVKGG